MSTEEKNKSASVSNNSNAQQSKNTEVGTDPETISRKKIQEYIDEKKKLYDIFLTYIEDPESNDANFQRLIKTIKNLHQIESKEELNHFLNLIVKVFNNHHRDSSFTTKIFNILKYYKDQIKQTYSNGEIFELFKKSKLILLYLFENEIVKFDEEIYQSIHGIKENNGTRYSHFFYTEIKKFVGEKNVKELEKEILSINPNALENYESKRHEGENDSYICTLIRKDSVENFISHVTKNNINLNSQIKASLFETNSFLNDEIFILTNTNYGKKKEIYQTALIDYAAFFGSIEIFQYLLLNQAKITPFLWKYSIHSKNAELIHLLESNESIPKNQIIECFIESIKCHHNDFAEYIENNFIQESDWYDIKRDQFIQYHNYKYFPKCFFDKEFFYLNYFDFNIIVENIIKMKTIELSRIFELYYYEKSEKYDRDSIQLYYLLSKRTTISDECFQKNSYLKKIVLPNSIESIGKNSFHKCQNLEEIIIPSSVRLIDKHAFRLCTNLSYIKIPPFSVTTIESAAFFGCESLTEFVIPYSVTSINSYVFSGCCSLKYITIPSSVTSIGDYSFQDCINLEQIIIPSTVKSIGSHVFMNCRSLKKVSFRSKIESIGNNSFQKCSKLIEINIPDSVTSIGNYAFDECSSIKQILFPSSVKSIGCYVCRKCKELTKVSIPSLVESIERFSFSGCSNLKEVSIPNSVKSIGKNAFNGSLLKKVDIPLSVTSIGDSAFQDCKNLTKIKVPASLAYNENVFKGCSSLSSIEKYS